MEWDAVEDPVDYTLTYSMGKILETYLDQGREAGSDDVMRNDALYFYGAGEQAFNGGTEDRG